jgi:transcriptional regulator with XRE-family HTH domain
MDIRQRIEALAARRGIQKKDLAERMGKRKENLNTLITNPKWDTIELVAQALGIEPWELFREEIEAAGLEIVKKGADPAPSPAPTGVGSLGAEEQPSAGGQQASDGERPDLITIDPVTGESRKYKLIG